MSLYISNGKLLVANGRVAASAACCCGQLLRKDIVTVEAVECMYFRWAPAGYQGPYGESGDSQRPTQVPKPSGAVSAIIIPDNRTWCHGPFAEECSDADGKVGDVRTVNHQYQSPIYNSQNIKTATAPMNTLMGMWSTGNPADWHTLYPIGSGEAALVPTGAVELVLAFHDENDWDNNLGAQTVSIWWYGSVTPCYRCKDATIQNAVVTTTYPPNTSNCMDAAGAYLYVSHDIGEIDGCHWYLKHNSLDYWRLRLSWFPDKGFWGVYLQRGSDALGWMTKYLGYGRQLGDTSDIRCDYPCIRGSASLIGIGDCEDCAATVTLG